MIKHAYAIILAGGRGERFWPLSTTRRPKQFLSLIGGQPLIAAAVAHLRGIIPPSRILIVTNNDLVATTRRVLPKFPRANIIGEPLARDTAAAITLGAAHIHARDPQAVFCVLTADHVMGDLPIFQRTLSTAIKAAAQTARLLTIGMRPTFPNTAFGWLEAASSPRKPFAIVPLKRFVEKPDLSTATRYLKSGRYFWNSGMFIWSLKTFEAALAEHQPQLLQMLHSIKGTLNTTRHQWVVKKIYQSLPKISVDYAIMEKMDTISMIKGDFAWDDVGCWSALASHFAKDESGNTIAGQAVGLDTSDNIVVDSQGLTALLGVKNLIVVRAGASTLICARERAQDVKKLVELLRTRGHTKYL